ncbi:unnamed protein product [Mytilus coruscus]|uniref:Uncharacterized protein n=1 Tax=Mytilus coruscus TaxID=42192 RepID=A0A6J8BLI0_MYTCO|nr:unnamed protein product [Mytilus coruscus]
MAAIIQSFSILSQCVAQCSSGLQHTVNLIANQKSTESDPAKKFRSGTVVPEQKYGGRTTSRARIRKDRPKLVTAPSLGYSSTTMCHTAGVRSYAYTNVDILAPSLQRNIIGRSFRDLKEIDIECNVVIPIPVVDCGKGDTRNIMTIDYEKLEKGYRLITNHADCDFNEITPSSTSSNHHLEYNAENNITAIDEIEHPGQSGSDQQSAGNDINDEDMCQDCICSLCVTLNKQNWLGVG